MRGYLYALLAVLMIGGSAQAQTSPWITTGAAFPNQHQGWADFCQRYPTDTLCTKTDFKPVRLEWTPELERTLNELNTRWNKKIRYVSDSAQYGILEYWNYPTSGKGDCEDYAPPKIKEIVEKLKLPAAAFSYAMIKDPKLGWHGGIIVHTTKGDFFMDIEGKIKRWDKTGYRFVAIQAPWNKSVWLYVPDPKLLASYGKQ